MRRKREYLIDRNRFLVSKMFRVEAPEKIHFPWDQEIPVDSLHPLDQDTKYGIFLGNTVQNRIILALRATAG